MDEDPGTKPGYDDEAGDQLQCAQPPAWDDGGAVLTPTIGGGSPQHEEKIILVL